MLSRNSIGFAAAFCALAALAPGTAWANAPAVGKPTPPLSLSKILRAPSDAQASWDALRGKVVVPAAEPRYHPCPASCLVDHWCFSEQTVYFKPTSSLLSTKAEGRIQQVARYLNAHPLTAVRIEGYCDDRGSEEHNRWLGGRRARACARELMRLGIAADRIETISYGEHLPADSGHDRKARQRNRRAQFVLLNPPGSEDPSMHNFASYWEGDACCIAAEMKKTAAALILSQRLPWLSNS